MPGFPREMDQKPLHQAADSVKFPVNFPVSREFHPGARFDGDCIRHHAFACTGDFHFVEMPINSGTLRARAPVFDKVSWSDTLAFHNTLVVGSSPTSSTTQSPTTGEILPICELRGGLGS